MKIITPINILEQLSSRSPIELECLTCKNKFIQNKHRVQDCLKSGGLSGAFCSQKCSTTYKHNAKYTNVNCKFCNNNLEILISDLNPNGNNFCNPSCSARYFNQFRIAPKTKLTCHNCKTEFIRSNYDIKQSNRHHFCSRKCSKTARGITVIVNVKCTNCQKDIQRNANKVKDNKYYFCSRSCQAIYGNKTFNRSTRFGINKSRAESKMVEIIKKDFPNLEIRENDRTILNGLELDLYIPEKNIGIELNGPCHYIPIFGEKELSKTKNKDIVKKETMQKLKIHFFQINIMGAGNKLPEILNNAYIEHIKPLLS